MYLCHTTALQRRLFKAAMLTSHLASIKAFSKPLSSSFDITSFLGARHLQHQFGNAKTANNCQMGSIVPSQQSRGRYISAHNSALASPNSHLLFSLSGGCETGKDATFDWTFTAVQGTKHSFSPNQNRFLDHFFEQKSIDASDDEEKRLVASYKQSPSQDSPLHGILFSKEDWGDKAEKAFHAVMNTSQAKVETLNPDSGQSNDSDTGSSTPVSQAPTQESKLAEFSVTMTYLRGGVLDEISKALHSR